MAYDKPRHYWIHTITLTDDMLDELEAFVQSGRAEYVAGKLIGMLRVNGKMVVPKDEPIEPIVDPLAPKTTKREGK